MLVPSDKTKDDVQLEDYVRAIADLMKPWRFPESDVFVAIQEELEDMRRNFPETPEMGVRSENKRRAERVIDAFGELYRATASQSFIASLVYSSEEYRSAELALTEAEEWELEDLDKLFIEKKKEAAEELAQLFERVAQLVRQCERMVINPPGIDPRFGHQQNWVACGALLLWLNLSMERPTAGNKDSKFCRFTSLIWQVVTGKERNLEAACKTVSRKFL